MKRRALKVARWVERMNAPDADMPEYGNCPTAFLPNDAVPETLEQLFRHMAGELFPEMLDRAAWLRLFVAETNPQEGAPVTEGPHQRIVGMVATCFREVALVSGFQSYMLYFWQRVTDVVDGLAPGQEASARS